MENTKEEFKKLSGIDLTDHEHSGVFPYYKDGSKWSSISRGKAWQMYAQWLEDQSTSQKETIDRLMDILQKTTETLMAVRRHGLREEEGYETVVTLVGETIHESEQLLKETEPIDQ